MTSNLFELITQRDALSHRIKIIESGIKKAAYDASMTEQHLNCNERRIAEGKRQVSAGEFSAGLFDEEIEP